MGALPHFFFGQIPGPQHYADVFLNGHPGIKCEILEDHGHARIEAHQLVAVVAHFAVGGGRQTSDQAQQGGFSAAVGPQDAKDFILQHLEIDVLQHPDILAPGTGKVFLDATELADGGGHGDSYRFTE